MKPEDIQVALMQINPLVGDVEGNMGLIKRSLGPLVMQHKPLVAVFPELSLLGYPPEDLLHRTSILDAIEVGINNLLAFTQAWPQLYLVVGTAWRCEQRQLKNAALVLSRGNIISIHEKLELPNYQVFDEMRYFTPNPSASAGVFDAFGVRFGLSVCEDIWFSTIMNSASAQGAQIMLNLNASPYHQGKQALRIETIQKRQLDSQALSAAAMPLVYVNQAGGQDELVFDGGSFVMQASGEVIQYEVFKTLTAVLNLNPQTLEFQPDPESPDQPLVLDRCPLNEIYQALVLGTRDYVQKNGFNAVVLGLSGGIDSALTLAIAVSALGAHAVEAVMMPFEYTAQASLDDAKAQTQTLGVTYKVRSIAPMYNAMMAVLAEDFKGLPTDVAEENIQARCRGMVLMALSNKFNHLVLTTGNKSEMAVGYSTLYGDMAGGFDILKDLPKTLVYALSRHLNANPQLVNPAFKLGVEVIPDRVITRPPSAELRPDQTDQDSLPDYEVLDGILKAYVEEDQSLDDIVALGYDQAMVLDVLNKVDRNEHKRRQAPLGVRLSQKAFGRDRRLPITSGWRHRPTEQ